jgi:hypothetical protein
MRKGPWLMIGLLAALTGCTTAADRPAQRADSDAAFLGVYRGSFATAQTEDPTDDLNYRPCDPASERCLGGDEPLVDVLLTVRRDAAGSVRLAFYRTRADLERGDALDLLGRGCGTTLGALVTSGRDAGTGARAGRVPLAARNRLCLNRLRPTATHELRVEFGTDAATGVAFVDLLLDRDVRSANYLFVEEEGKRRRVRIDLDNTLDTATDTRYRVCIEDDLGDFSRCVMTDRELRRFVLPVPLPDGAALSYTWWYDLVPNLKRTSGLQEVERYSGRFVREGEPAPPG